MIMVSAPLPAPPLNFIHFFFFFAGEGGGGSIERAAAAKKIAERKKKEFKGCRRICEIVDEYTGIVVVVVGGRNGIENYNKTRTPRREKKSINPARRMWSGSTREEGRGHSDGVVVLRAICAAGSGRIDAWGRGFNTRGFNAAG